MIPEGWERTTIGAHVDVLTGYAFKSSDYSSGPDDIRLLRGDNVAQHRIRWRDAQKLPQEKARGLDRFALRLGDFVIALDRTWIPAGVKIAEITEADLPSLLVQRVARLRSKPSLEQSLMRQFFSGHGFEQYVKSVQTETAVPHISPNDLRDLAILLPPLPEQKRIAETLQTWDRAIETVEALIANARAQKQALMQHLLPQGTTPPKKRLPGFSGEWRETSLGSLGETYGGLTGKSINDFGSGSPFITYKNVFENGFVDPNNIERVRIDPGERQHAIRNGDILFTTSSETPEEVGMSSVVNFDAEAIYLNSFCFGFRPNSTDAIRPHFAGHFFRSPSMRRQIAVLAQGSTRYNISKSALLKLTFHLPEADEQDAIAGLLGGCDAELLKLTGQLIALRQEKAALMQQLLTGKRRVKLPESEVA